jgi:PPOX class probable F420-dependent enzyme
MDGLPMPALPEPLVERLLETWPVARFATRRPDGAPHLVPIVFAQHAGALWTPIDAKPKRSGELARVRNLRADPRVAVLLDRYAADWSRLWWIRLEGRAALRALGPDAPDDAPEPGAAGALRAKYPQYRETPLFRGEPVLIRIEVERLASWCAGEAAIAELTESGEG